MSRFLKRLGRLENQTGPAIRGGERWIIDRNTSRNLETGETITTAELEARPLPEGAIRIIRHIVTPTLEDAL